jgi:two-component system response regulator YesN
MWKVIIADDEPKIRKGLRQNVDWSFFDMEVIGEAEDGLEALEISEAEKPHILLVDICMPFMSGLEFVEKLLSFLPDSIIIIITGHDEFSYAQQALKFGVFDYLLKPVSQDQLNAVMAAAKGRLIETKYMEWSSQQISKHLPLIKERFLNDWIEGRLSEIEVKEQLGFLQISLDEKVAFGMFLVKIIDKIQLHNKSREWERQLLLFAVQNVVQDVVMGWGSDIVFRDRKDNIIVIVPLDGRCKFEDEAATIISAVERYVKKTVIVLHKPEIAGVMEMSQGYEELFNEAIKESNITPIVMLAQKYIREHFEQENLTLQAAADAIKISPDYLSRLLRQEIGLSFIDYLTQIRIQQAVRMLHDPTKKIYEIAGEVGYNNQHYFSTAFKKVLGVSPIEYRRGGGMK